MGYWIYMTVTCLLVPGIITAIGSFARKSAPKEINHIYGYRTAMSMKNRDTWEFANLMFGRLAFRVGLVMLAVTLLVMLFTFFCSQEVVTVTGLIVITVQIFPLLGIIPVVEKALKNTFRPDGSRK